MSTKSLRCVGHLTHFLTMYLPGCLVSRNLLTSLMSFLMRACAPWAGNPMAISLRFKGRGGRRVSINESFHILYNHDNVFSPWRDVGQVQVESLLPVDEAETVVAHQRPQPGGHGLWNRSPAIFKNVLEARPISSLQPLVSKYVTCVRRRLVSLPAFFLIPPPACYTYKLCHIAWLISTFPLLGRRSASASQQFLHPPSLRVSARMSNRGQTLLGWGCFLTKIFLPFGEKKN